ncbi:hypothetical protein GALL_535540 [mine drainage metagenome]|uniref:Uncharacterized protein n=1 Tax=mine drainage metagenome TaxID=410659 RepID=A0A1J5PMU5_9ZZZZ
MQTARNLIAVLVEFAARVQLGHDDLCRRNALFLVQVNRNAAPVVADRNRIVGVDFHAHRGRVARQSLVNAVVHHLINHVVQTRPVVGIPDIHTGAFPHSLQAFENLDRIGAVFFHGLLVVGHAVFP